MKHSLLLATLAISLAPCLTRTSLQPLRLAGQQALAMQLSFQRPFQFQQQRIPSTLTATQASSLSKEEHHNRNLELKKLRVNIDQAINLSKKTSLNQQSKDKLVEELSRAAKLVDQILSRTNS